ncbi:hypothetical protein ACUY3K_00525 [Corynebacterium uberis]|uniref:hypothetical protein n=1 Tax=Corynebacterium TaxID=1716 RepID=UPI001D09FCA3|nr:MULTISPECIES: hypothetical protein [Corynebacterium]MCZ9309085.1 hypothetical protein [Corynebacterium sp. c6VSa_13]UDL74449.1 hypothetical protein LH391_04465 [Corynebacterium uberis]UDL76716.1 hypothetical protein LH393_04930 [Corynebacterium uberis]UDL78929.1 hypothetical protein LH394_04920 [Corynebacterium uberis]UDL81207.1 hypothetical protein LH392_05340 [Corynebacterium uberis]
MLWLDEPTAGLDPNHRADLLDLLRGFADAGTCVVISTHISGDVAGADRVLFLDGGVITAEGSVGELLERFGDIDAAFRALTGGGDQR